MKNSTFGEKFRNIRLERQWSQEEMASFLGTTKQVISRYETNQRTPKITIAAEYARKLGVKLEYLIDDDLSSPPPTILNDNIKKYRLLAQMTLEDLAKKVGVSRQTIQRYESGVISNVPSDKIEKLAIALKTTPAHLMGWDTEEIGGGESIIAAHRKSPFADITDEEAAMLEAVLEAYRANPKSKK